MQHQQQNNSNVVSNGSIPVNGQPNHQNKGSDIVKPLEANQGNTRTGQVPQLSHHAAAFVTPKLPTKVVSYVPTSKEAEELDDSFMFSDDILMGNRRVFTILQKFGNMNKINNNKRRKPGSS